MVPDLDFNSHPSKKLEEHIIGVQKCTLKRCDFKIAEYAALFHDAGKINPNFQKKIFGEKTSGYSNHSFLSAIGFINCVLKNKDFFAKEFTIKNNNDFALKVFQIAHLIARHHSNIQNFESAFGTNEIEEVEEFIKKEFLPFSDFYNKKLNKKYFDFKAEINPMVKRFISFTNKFHKPTWKKNALQNFLDTQFAFSALIEGDKRDAGNNKNYNFDNNIKNSINELSENLSKTFKKFAEVPEISELNKIRTDIRIEGVEGVKKALENNKRVFTLTAPTGAGKTFTLLAVAEEIQKQKGKLGIIYSLPFLSITEQVQKIVDDLLETGVLSVNSKTENPKIDIAQEQYENNPSKENQKRILNEEFIQSTFDHPFIITTFVQFFETLVSNKNSTLLRLPNFANRIFLIDEVQALPPRLYIFFSAWLHAFCKMNNSYAVISTATMPKLDFPIKDFLPDDKNPALLFKNYLEDLPVEIIEPKKYFDKKIFNRYIINTITDEDYTHEKLAEDILEQKQSSLVILNTISDTKKLYDLLSEKDENTILLNTHFTPESRTLKIDKAKQHLKNNEKIILISTQLIEAGVDIDFPIVYRDLCPLPSLIQSAGRCNRNGKMNMGQIFFFELKDENQKSRANLIYRKEASRFLKFIKKYITKPINENELFNVQALFFEEIRNELTIGEFELSKDKYGNAQKANMIELVNHAKFETLGKFKLINNDLGNQYQIYVEKDEFDDEFEKLSDLIMQPSNSYTDYAINNSKVTSQLKKMSSRIINLRIRDKSLLPPFANLKEVMGLNYISSEYYSHETGIQIGKTDNLFL